MPLQEGGVHTITSILPLKGRRSSAIFTFPKPTPIDGRPRFVKRSINDGEKVKIAAIDPDFV